MVLVIYIVFSYSMPQNYSILFLLAWLTLGFFRILLVVSSVVWSSMIIVTELLSIYFCIWKFIPSLIQWVVLNSMSEMFLISFGGHPLLSLAVLKTATLRSLAPINIQGRVNSYPSPSHTSFYSCWGAIQLECVYSQQPSLFGFPTLAGGSTL